MSKLLPLTSPQPCSLLTPHPQGTGAGANGRCSSQVGFRAAEIVGPVAVRNASAWAVGPGVPGPF